MLRSTRSRTTAVAQANPSYTLRPRRSDLEGVQWFPKKLDKNPFAAELWRHEEQRENYRPPLLKMTQGKRIVFSKGDYRVKHPLQRHRITTETPLQSVC